MTYGQIRLLEVVGVTDTTPKEFRVRVDGLEMTVQAEALNTQKLFNRMCIEHLGRSFAPLATDDWYWAVNRALENYTERHAQSPTSRRRLLRPVG